MNANEETDVLVLEFVHELIRPTHQRYPNHALDCSPFMHVCDRLHLGSVCNLVEELCQDLGIEGYDGAIFCSTSLCVSNRLVRLLRKDFRFVKGLGTPTFLYARFRLDGTESTALLLATTRRRKLLALIN